MRTGMPAGFDAWLTTDLDMVDVSENWEMLRRCSCGCWLKQVPDSTEIIERLIKEETFDGFEMVDCSFYRLTFVCSRCEEVNVFDEL